MEKDSYKTTVHTSQTLPETLLKDIEIIFRTHTMTKDLTVNKLANGVTQLVWSYEDEKLSEKYELFARLDDGCVPTASGEGIFVGGKKVEIKFLPFK